MKLEIEELHHVALHVKDVDLSIEFYKSVIGFQQILRPSFSFPGAWFRIGKMQELHLIGGRELDVHSSNRGNHFAMRVTNIQLADQYFQEKNIERMGPKRRPDGAWQIFIKDVDGHTIELFQD